jgi:two-component system chemotaxis response regulator CheY
MRVTAAEDGVLGVQAFQAGDYDAVITDINMPNLDGFGVIEAIRAGGRNRRVPILVLTTESGADLKARARAAAPPAGSSSPSRTRRSWASFGTAVGGL